MAEKALAVTLTLGAVLGSGFLSFFGKAKNSILDLGGQLDALKQQKNVLPRLGFAAAANTRAEIEKAKADLAGLQAKRSGGDKSDALVKEIELAGNRVEWLTGKYKAQQRVMGKQIADLTKQGKNYRTVGEEISKLTKKLEVYQKLADARLRLNASGGEFFRFLRNGIASASALSGSIFMLSNSAATVGDELAKTSSRLGLAASALQGYRYAAGLAGVAQTDLDQGLKDLNLRVGQAMLGQGEAVKMAQRYRVNLSALASMPTDQRLAAIADVMKGMSSTAEQAAFANAFLGESGVKMLNMLKNGSEGLAKARAEAVKYDYIFTEEDRKNAETFKDSLHRVTTSFNAIKNAAGAKLFAGLSSAMDRIANAFAANRGSIVEAITNITSAFMALIPSLIDFGSKVLSVAGKLLSFPGVAQGVIVALGLLGASLLAIKAIRFGTDIVKTSLAIYQFGRYTLWSAAQAVWYSKVMTVLKGGFVHYITQLKLATLWENTLARTRKAGAAFSMFGRGGGAGRVGTGIMSGLRGILPRVLGWGALLGGLFVKLGVLIKGVFVAVGAAIGAIGWPVVAVVAAIVGAGLLIWKYWQPIKEFFLGLGSAIWERISPAIESIKASFASVWETVAPTLGKLWEGFQWVAAKLAPLGAVLAKLLFFPLRLGFGIFLKVLGTAWDGIAGFVSGAVSIFTWLWNAIGSGLSTIRNLFTDFFGFDPLNLIKEGWGNAIDWLTGRLSWLSDKLDGVLGWLGLGDDEEQASARAGAGSGEPALASASAAPLRALNPPPLTATNARTVQMTSSPSITINTQPGQDANAIASEVMRRVEQSQRDLVNNSLRDF